MGSYAQALQHKQMLSDEQHAIKRDDLLKSKDSLTSQLASYKDANGNVIPEMKDQHDKTMSALAQNQFEIGQLYDPIKAPGRLQQDWHYLREKIHGIKAPKESDTPAAATQTATAQTPSATLSTPTSPITTPELPGDAGQPATPPVTLPGMSAVPKGATPTMAVAKPKGLVAAGNIPIWNRPSVLNSDGTHSSELSISVGDDKGNQTLIPLIVDGKFLTPDGKMPSGSIPHNADEWAKASPEWKALKMNAVKHYQQTGQHLGKFGGPTAEDDVDAYAQVLHNRGSIGAQAAIPAGAPSTVAKAPTPAAPPVSWGQAQVLKKQAAAMQQAQTQAALLAAGVGQSPTQQAMADFRTKDAVHQAQLESTLKMAEKLGLSDTQMEELKQQLVGLKNVTPKAVSGPAGQPYKGADGRYYKPVLNPDGLTMGSIPMPPDWKPNSKAVRGTLVNSKANGWIQTWVDPYNPSRVVGFQKVTPGRQYTGSTSGSQSTDAFGFTTSSSRTTMPTGSAPVDFDTSGMQELPQSFNGEDIPTPTGQAPASPSPVAPTPSGSPNKTTVATPTPPTSVAKPVTGGVTPKATKPGVTPGQLKSRIPAPPPASASPLALDSAGHIPLNSGANPNLIGAANQLLDGMDVEKLTIPAKYREAAQNLAEKYGYKGQGMFNPQQKLQIREAGTFLNEAVNNDALSVLDSPLSRQKIIAIMDNAEGKAGWIEGPIARFTNLNPKEAEFLRMFRQLTGTISGLTSLSRGGKSTEAGIKRLMSELPNPNESHSADDAKKRLGRLIKEIEVAKQTGNADTIFSATGSQGDASSSGGGLSLDDFAKKHNLPPIKK